MTIHSDIPTRAQLEQSSDHRAASSVLIYLPTSSVSRDALAAAAILRYAI